MLLHIARIPQKKMSTKQLLLLVAVVVSFSALTFGQTGMVKRIISKSDKMDFGAGGTVAIMGAPPQRIETPA